MNKGIEGLVLAAGTGSRLYPRSTILPKALTEVNGVPILANALDRFRDVGISRTVIVIGHLGDSIRRQFGSRWRGMELSYVTSVDYAVTGTARSFALGAASIAGDILLLEGDVLFDRQLLPRLLEGKPRENRAAVVPFRPPLSGSTVGVNAGLVTDIRRDTQHDPEEARFKTVNAYLFRRGAVAELLRSCACAAATASIEHAIAEMVAMGGAIRAVNCDDVRWWEIDTEDDLRYAEKVFSAEAADASRL